MDVFLRQGASSTVLQWLTLIKGTGIEERVKNKVLIIPGLVAPASGGIEDDTGWRVLVGPRDSSGIPDFLEKLASE